MVLVDKEPADTRLKINSSGQLDIYFTKKIRMTKNQEVQFMEQFKSTEKATDSMKDKKNI